MVSLCGRLTRIVSARRVPIKTVRKKVAAMRSPRETSEAGNFASGLSNLAISLAPAGGNGAGQQWLSSFRMAAARSAALPNDWLRLPP
jgi:hypothetical protein